MKDDEIVAAVPQHVWIARRLIRRVLEFTGWRRKRYRAVFSTEPIPDEDVERARKLAIERNWKEICP